MRTIRSFQTAYNRVCVWIQGLGYFNKICTAIKIKGLEIICLKWGQRFCNRTYANFILNILFIHST